MPPPLQQWFVELVSIISDALVGLSAIVVGVVAIVGIQQWRAELVGRRRFEVAHKMMRLALEFKDEFKTARYMFTTPDEWADRKRSASENEAEGHMRDEQFARWRRLGRPGEILRELRIASWDAEILSLGNADDLVAPFRRTFKKFLVQFEEFFNMRLTEVRGLPMSPEQLERMRELHTTVYGVGEDEHSLAIDATVDKLMTELKRYVR